MPRLLAMPRTISNEHDVFRMLSPEQRLRAIVVLIFAVTIGVMLLNFPGPLFQEVAKAPRFSPEWTETLPMAADEQTVVLHQRATAALEAIRARKSNER
jgi:hypothetical protein